MARAIWNGEVVADSDVYEELEGNVYFPPGSIHQRFFVNSDKTTVCPWKGTASYYTLVVDGRENRDAAWYYPETKPEAAKIKGHVAFWKGVEIEK